MLAAAADSSERATCGLSDTGSGWVAAVGQSATPNDNWPQFEVINYTRTLDFQNRSSPEYVRRQGNYPAQGGGGTPLAGEQPQQLYSRAATTAGT